MNITVSMPAEIVNTLIKHAKEDYFLTLIAKSNDQKKLFQIVNDLSNKKQGNCLPDHSSAVELADRFVGFFSDKIVKIRLRLEDSAPTSAFPIDVLTDHSASAAPVDMPATMDRSLLSEVPPLVDVPVPTERHIPTDVPLPVDPSVSSMAADHSAPITSPIPPVFDELSPADDDEIRKIIVNTKTTTCQLDPLPTSFLKIIIDVLLPVITNIINMSFKEGYIPDNLKLAVIIPLLKKPGLDLETLKIFRPVSNLSYLSKVMERVASARLLNHMSINGLHELFQSSYKKFHSTETALIKIQSDILSALDNKKCVLLTMLDLSAAFDTIDHSTLLSRLKSEIGVSGKVYKWFSSYLSDRKQSVLIHGMQSKLMELIYGVPQGSVLGPILFIIYMGPLGRLLKSLGVNYHFYADDSQIYVTFNVPNADEAVKKVEEVASIIKKWMKENFLCLNEDKTEVLLIASKSDHTKLKIPHIKIGNELITPSKEAKNIGFVFDNLMDCKSHIKQTCKSGWYHLRNIGRIRPYLDQTSTATLVHSFITSRIDINNTLLLGLPDLLIHKLQLLQNAAARLVMKLPKHSHITGTLQDLHWLPVSHRIEFKCLLFVFKALHDMAPAYLTDLLERKSSSRLLRSNDKKLLVIPKSRTVRYGDRNFANVAPLLWNNLPLSLREADKLCTFKSLLKTHLYKKAYDHS